MGQEGNQVYYMSVVKPDSTGSLEHLSVNNCDGHNVHSLTVQNILEQVMFSRVAQSSISF